MKKFKLTEIYNNKKPKKKKKKKESTGTIVNTVNVPSKLINENYLIDKVESNSILNLINDFPNDFKSLIDNSLKKDIKVKDDKMIILLDDSFKLVVVPTKIVNNKQQYKYTLSKGNKMILNHVE